MQTITVGYLTTELSSRDGWGRYSRSLVESVNKLAKVKVLTMREAQNDTATLTVLKVLPYSSFNIWNQVRTVIQILKYFKNCDVIHSLVEPYAPAVAIAGHILGIPTTMTLHGTYSVPPQRMSIKRLLMKYMYRRMVLVTTGSVYTEKKVRDSVPLGECVVIPNGVDLERFHVIDGMIKKDMIMTVGMLKPRKGVDTVIEATAIVKDRFPTLQYIVVGDDSHDAFSAKLHAMVKELNLEDRVFFKEGVDDDELLKLYNQAKVFVLAARDVNGSFEGFPMVFFEANACGTPVITTKGFGSEYAIKNGYNGYIVDPQNPEAVAEAIINTLSNESNYLVMRSNALAVAAKHTWPEIGNRLFLFYEKIIELKNK